MNADEILQKILNQSHKKQTEIRKDPLIVDDFTPQPKKEEHSNPQKKEDENQAELDLESAVKKKFEEKKPVKSKKNDPLDLDLGENPSSLVSKELEEKTRNSDFIVDRKIEKKDTNDQDAS